MKLFMVIAVLAAMLAPSALAAGPNQPYDKTSAVPVAPANHGIVSSIRLNAIVFDGKDARFTATVRNVGQSLPYVSTAIIWSFDGNSDARRYGRLSNLGTAASTSVYYTDLDHDWIQIGRLGNNKIWHLNGMWEVPNRNDLGQFGSGAKYVQSVCVQLVVKADYPGEPNAGWREYSSMSCRQYSVQQ